MYEYLNEDHCFDQAEALHCYLSLNHEGQWSKRYKLLCRSKFKPSPLWSESKVVNNEFYCEIERLDDDQLEKLMDEMDDFLSKANDGYV